MKKTQITAAMLYNCVHCPHRVALDLYGNAAERDKISPFVQLLWERGHAFEQEVIAGLKIPFVNLREAPNSDRERLTLEAMAAGEPLIYGGRIAADDLLGEPDLLRRQASGYVSGEIKSGSGLEGGSKDSDGKPKEHYAVQLGLYTDILKRKGLQGDADPFVWDIHGQEVTYRLGAPRGPKTPETLWDKYQATLQVVRSIVSERTLTSPALVADCKVCHWRTYCFRNLEQVDDLTLVPELGRARRDNLYDYVRNVEELANVDLSTLIRGKKSLIPGIGVKMLERFRARARLQKQPNAKPYFREEVTFPPNRLEFFFDVETDPMRDLCYLHGIVERSNSDPATEKYVSFFAEEPTQEAEKTAFEQAWKHIQAKQPSALYFYSPYEKTVWRQLAARFPEVVTDGKIVNLFDSDVAFDLYHALVHSKMEWPTRDLSIKKIASFLGFNWRDPEPSGTAAVQWYHEWVETGDNEIRQRILEYNEDDCLAMRVLVDSVREL